MSTIIVTEIGPAPETGQIHAVPAASSINRTKAKQHGRRFVIYLKIEIVHCQNMYQISLKDFRGFHDQEFVDIRPITLLVGENSSGKSSFLAAIKYMLDFSSTGEEASFNKDPFQLGTFQQISHHRGGRAGRAREFVLKLKQNVTPRPSREKHAREVEFEYELKFATSESQAVISELGIKTSGKMLRVSISGERMRFEYLPNRKESYYLRDIRIPRRSQRADFSRFLPLLLPNLSYAVLDDEEEDQESKIPPNVLEDIRSIVSYTRAFADQLSGNVEAVSAIRTKPLRTYTPGLEVQDGEGSHVPFEIAKLYRSRNKDAWRNLKGSLELYGQQSEMYKEINVKSFGKSASDPFQIQFSSDGPKTNLVDLGYGTSQVLPILYSVSTSNRRSKFLVQQPEVHLHPKAQAALGSYFVESYIENGNQFILETHSDYIVDRVRAAIYEGKIDPYTVSLLYFERKKLENKITEINLDSFGEPINPPGGYRSFFMDEQLRTLGID